MNKYETGKFLVLIHDKYGTRQEIKKCDTYQEALECGRKAIHTPPMASCVVLRTLYNSLDKNYPWTVSPDEIREMERQENVPIV
jgi:hypothetical protein